MGAVAEVDDFGGDRIFANSATAGLPPPLSPRQIRDARRIARGEI